jgi:hypothetical protein
LIEQAELNVPSTLSGYFDDTQRQAENTSTQAILTKPVTKIAQTKLLRLIEVTEYIVVNTIDMEGGLVNFLADQGKRLHRPTKLGFVVDEDISTVAITIAVSPDRRQAATELQQFLQALRQEVIAEVDWCFAAAKYLAATRSVRLASSQIFGSGYPAMGITGAVEYAENRCSLPFYPIDD